jgi:uncharacterized membrane protein
VIDVVLAQAVHITSVVVWIGGVGFLTTVLLPAIRRSHMPAERLTAFLQFEGSFVGQARIAVALVGLSGIYMVHQLGLWGLFYVARSWWMHAMVSLWLTFAVMLFILEPFYFHRRWEALAQNDATGQAFAKLQRLHQRLFFLSLTVVFAASAGAHGVF